MAPGHRSPIRWVADRIRAIKTPANTPGSEQAKRHAVRTAEPSSGKSEDLGHPEGLTESEEEPNVTVSRTGPSRTQTHTSTNTDTGEADEYHPVAVDLGTTSVVDDLGDSQATTVVECGPKAALSPRSDGSKIPRDAESPIWLKSIERFGKEHPEEYKLMVGQLNEIQKLKDGHTWDTWLNRQDLDKASTEANYKWLRKCKAYMPSLANVRVLATGLGNLDPHKVAPLVIAGVFVLVELCFGLMDPSTRDKAMGLLLKTNIVINKWVSREGDLRRIKLSQRSFMQSVNEKVKKIEKGLDALYFDSLVLMSSVYGAGRSRRGRFAASLISGFPEWERALHEIQNADSAYGELKNQVESMLKTNKENLEVLDWIRGPKEDPEPLHQTIKERTGVDDPSSTGGNWFLQTSEFTSWVDGIRHNTPRQRVFWLKGSMGTGKTTLLCRTIYHFENSPIGEVKFVPYYCHGSGSGSGPRYETILRALCRQLAWGSDGSIAEPAMQLYHPLKVVPDAQIPGKATWEQLLRDLIVSRSSNSIKIVFVVDALDECETMGDYVDLLKFLTDLPPHQDGPFFLVSSRPHVPVWRYFDRSVHTFDVVQDETTNEMQMFIQNQIKSKKEIHWEDSIFFKNPEMLDELSSALLASAGGMFRWVEIWIGIFFPRNKNAVRRQGKAQERLNDLKNLKSLADLQPDENDTSGDDRKKMALAEAYKKLWQINGDYGEDKDLQTRLFQIITASFESLTPQRILEAVCFDSSTPPDHYEELHSDHVAGLYSSFLRVNREGYLEYEHLSAKMFVEEMEYSNKRPFSSQESHQRMAEIAICAIEQPSHRIWIDANIDLVGRGPSPKASLRRPDLTIPEEVTDAHFRHALENSSLFGSYLFRFWLRHCQVLRHEEQFIQRMSDLFQRARPSFQGWVISQAECYGFRSLPYRNTLTRPANQGSEARQTSPFLCMVSFGFHPISYTADQPALLQGFEDSKVRNLDGKTALHVACEASDIKIVEDLLKLEYMNQGSYSASLSVKDNRGRIPLHLAIDHNMAKMLLQYELRELRGSLASTPSTGPTRSQLLHVRDNNLQMAIYYIVERGGDLITWILRESLVEPPALNELLYHALGGRAPRIPIRGPKTVNLLLENGADPNMNIEGCTSALSLALLKTRTDIAQMLLDHGARWEECKESEDLKSTFDRAVSNVDLNMLDFLHGMGLSMDTDYKVPGFTALSHAVTSQRLDVIEFLLERGADVNRTRGTAGATRRTVLHRAVSKGNVKMAELLLDHGADVNASPANFSTPLASAVTHGNREMAELLMSRGADATLLRTSDKETLDEMIQR